MLKEASCNINIACESNAKLMQIASGVGVMVIPSTFGDQGLCSSTLMNNPDTEINEPYLMTANHCIESQEEAVNVDIIWDYRATACDTNDPPEWADFVREAGVGQPTKVRETEKGAEFLAVCSTKSVSDDRVAELTFRAEQTGEGGEKFADEYLAEIRAAATIVKR